MLISYPNFVSQGAQSQRGEYQIICTSAITFVTTYLVWTKAKNFEWDS